VLKKDLFITFISPQTISSHDSEFYVGRRGAPPLNLAYLARIVDNMGVEYDVIDTLTSANRFILGDTELFARGISIEETIIKIDPRTTVVSISSMFTSEWLVIRYLIRGIRKLYPDVLIIIGGENASALGVPILKYEPEIDIVFHGESESSLEELLTNLKNDKDIKSTQGIFYRSSIDQNIVKTPAHPRLLNINDHFPLWDKFPIQYYLDNKLSLSRIDVRSMPMLATRGCPYKCTFCSNESMWGSRYVMRSTESLKKEIGDHIANNGVTHFDFLDLATSVNKQWYKGFLEMMIYNFPGITWDMTVGTRSEVLDEEILTLMKKSGTNQLAYAPETGSKRMSKLIKKKLNHEKLYESVQLAVKVGIEAKANTIIGFPQETVMDLLKTIFMAFRLGWYGVKGVSVFIFTAYPGSEMFNELYNVETMSKDEYNKLLTYQSTNAAGARVFNIFELFKYPREQFYIFISNSLMVTTYMLSMIRKPKLLKGLFTGTPQAPVEMGIYSFLKKVGIIRRNF
jgi:anaerobic magnesium-protoporphyrin IX monomethyl ester cyclase